MKAIRQPHPREGVEGQEDVPWHLYMNYIRAFISQRPLPALNKECVDASLQEAGRRARELCARPMPGRNKASARRYPDGAGPGWGDDVDSDFRPPCFGLPHAVASFDDGHDVFVFHCSANTVEECLEKTCSRCR